MYNSYLHSKYQKSENEKRIRLEKSAHLLDIQSKVREKLLKKYKIRIAQKLLDINNDPVPIHSYDRSVSPKFLGESNFRLKPKDTRARINDALQQNIIYDCEPLNVQSPDFRPRHKEKEIQGQMKFTPKDRFERLLDKYFSDNSLIYTWEADGNSMTPIKNKTKKLYYKTLESVALNVSPESCSKASSKAFLQKVSSNSFGDVINDSEKLGILAQNALEKCKLRPSKGFRYVSANRTRLN